jgi:hypothetical protein
MAQAVMTPDGTEAPKRGRHVGRILLIIFLVLLVLLLVADRVGAVVAQKELASQAQKQLAAQGVTIDGTPTVDIHGFPFLTQVAAGHYGEVDIHVDHPAGQGVRLESLDIVATDVDAPTGALISGHAKVEAAMVTGTATIGWNAFRQIIDVSGATKYGVDPETMTITGGDDGRISVAAPVSFLGTQYEAHADGTLSVDKNVLHVKLGEIKITGNNVPAALLGQLGLLRNQLTFDTRIPALPYHLTIDSVHAAKDGIELHASATDVVLGG